MMSSCNPEKNKSNKDEKAQALKKAATAPKGRGKQSRGSAQHNTSVKHAKKEQNFTDKTRF